MTPAGRAIVLRGDARALPLPDASVDLIMTSPPYFALRSYTDGGEHYDGQIGSESTPAQWVANLLDCTREWMRVLKPTGSIFVNLGDKYSTGNSGQSGRAKLGERFAGGGHLEAKAKRASSRVQGMAPKSLLGLPWRYALACVDDLGLILRAEIIWSKPNCLSGGTMVYAKVKGRPTTIKVHDLCRAYAPDQVQLWGGLRWTQVLWWQPTGRHPDAAESMKAIRAARRRGDEPTVSADIEVELRSGERIGCTREHRWPTRRGLLAAGDLVVGDVLDTCSMPEGETSPAALDDETVGWFVGLYIAEGSRSEQTIQIAGHVKETERYKRLCELAEAFHGTCAVYATQGNAATINLTGRFLDAIIETYVGGRTAKDKHLRSACWQRSNRFLRAVLDGYLSGDGHWREDAHRWIVGFTDNDYLASDLRALGARLNLSVRLARCTHTGFDKQWPGWRGNITDPRRRRQPDSEIVAIRQSRARQFWDIGVADEPHLFALASGVLTHNSLPEPVTDRVRRSHEQVFHFTKAPRYFTAVDEIREPHTGTTKPQAPRTMESGKGMTHRVGGTDGTSLNPLGKLPGSVWDIASQPLTVPAELGVDHFAAFPMELPRRIILGWSPSGICVECGEVRRPVRGVDWSKVPHEMVDKRALTADETADWCRDFADWCASAGISRTDLDEAAGTSDMGGWWASRLRHRSQVPTPDQWAKLRTRFNPPPRFDDLVHLTRSVPVALFQVGVVDGAMKHRNREPSTRPDGHHAITGYACACPEPTAPTTPAVVLDPFGGTGTTALVASVYGRVGISVDRSADYCRLAAWRTADPKQIERAARAPKPRKPPTEIEPETDDTTDSVIDNPLTTEIRSGAMTTTSDDVKQIQDRQASARGRVIAASGVDDATARAVLDELAKVFREEADWWEARKSRGWKSTAEQLRMCASRVAGFAIGLTDRPVEPPTDQLTEAEAAARAACLHPLAARSKLSSGDEYCVECGQKISYDEAPTPDTADVMNYLTGATNVYEPSQPAPLAAMVDSPFTAAAPVGGHKPPVKRLAWEDLPRLAAELSAIPRGNVSHSFVTDMESCSLRVMLDRASRHNLIGARRPSWAAVGGTAFHDAVNALERSGVTDLGGLDSDQIWSAHFEVAVRNVIEAQPAVSPYADTKFWHASQGGKEAFDWWRVEGAEMLRRYVKGRLAEPRRDADLLINPHSAPGNYQPVLEFGYQTMIGGVVAQGYIDAAFVLPDASLLVVDFKTGRNAPESTFQLGEYAHVLKAMSSPAATVKGSYWLARAGEYTPPVDVLAAHPLPELEYRYRQALLSSQMGIAAPNVTPMNCVGCPFRDYCPTQG